MADTSPPEWIDQPGDPGPVPDYSEQSPEAETPSPTVTALAPAVIDLNDRRSRAQTALNGDMRFDFEVEAVLKKRGQMVRRNLMSDVLELHGKHGITEMTDDILSDIRFSLIWARNGQEPAKDKVSDAVSLIGKRNAYHPVKDYLAGLKWDGAPRLDAWLIDYAGAEGTPLNRAIGRKALCAAVRRVRKPGCKFDHMPVLQGPQGAMKSSLLAALCPTKDLFTDQLEVGADAKTTIEKSSGAWIVEMAELDGMGKRDANRVKSFITTQADRARLAYGRYPVTRQRQFVLFGTTNETSYLTDTTGNRRFWIVPVTTTDVAGLQDARDQLWAEAAAVEPDEALWLDDAVLRADAAAIAMEATDRGPWADLISGRIPEGPMKITAADVWLLVGIGPGDVNRLTKTHQSALRSAMIGLGFEKKDKGLRLDGKSVVAWLRGSATEAEWWAPEVRSASPPRLDTDW